MSKYSKGKIYTIRCINDDSKIYVGSTIQELCRRLSDHRIKSNNEKYKNTKLYQEVQDWNDWYIELYENFPCNNKTELNKKEGEIIREIGTLNKLIAGRTVKEYYEDNKEKINEKQKKWYEDNKKKELEKRKQRYNNNKEKELKQAKERYENNKEKINEKHKEYYENNKEYINQKVICEHCKAEINKQVLNRHKKSKKCINFVKKD
jgi:hypothetical protein